MTGWERLFSAYGPATGTGRLLEALRRGDAQGPDPYTHLWSALYCTGRLTPATVPALRLLAGFVTEPGCSRTTWGSAPSTPTRCGGRRGRHPCLDRRNVPATTTARHTANSARSARECGMSSCSSTAPSTTAVIGLAVRSAG